MSGPFILTALEAIYCLAIVTALVIGTCLGCRVYVGRRKGLRRGNAARGLLLCIGCLIAFAAAETTAAMRLSLMHGVPPLRGDPQLSSQFTGPTVEPETNLVVLGESSAEGMPFEKWFSVGKIVKWQLERAIPTRRFHLDLVAHRGDTLEGQYQKLAALTRRPDVLIVYCGHNEFANISWSRRVDHYIDERPPFGRYKLVNLVGQVSPLCRLIEETAEKYRVASKPSIDFQPELVDSPAYSDSDYAVRLGDFQRRLDAIAEYGERIKALTILVIPPANDADFEPNRSFLAVSTTRADRERFARDFQAARRLEDSDPAEAIEQYRALLAKQPGFAEIHYRLGVLLASRGALEEAYERFIAARDFDGLPMRCLTSFQQVYRTVASRHHCILVDGQTLFHKIAPNCLLDDHLFHDAVHPSLLGHVALAQGVLKTLHERRAFGWPDSSRLQPISSLECAAHFGLMPADWKSIAEQGYMYYHAVNSVRYDRRKRLAKQSRFEMAAKRIAAGEAPEALGLPNIGIPDEHTLRIP
jgi:hypothetical protein